jgi:hypothetical protein
VRHCHSVVLANQYSNESDALADFEAVGKLYSDLGVIDTYEAAGLTRKPNGKVEIVERTEEPTRQGPAVGFAVGLAAGAAIALFPAAGLGLAGLLGGSDRGRYRHRRRACCSSHEAIRSQGSGRAAR